MNINLSNEKIEILNKIFLRNYNGYTEEEISFIQKEAQDISIPEIASYFEYIQDEEDLYRPYENVMEQNLVAVVGSLYTCDYILDFMRKSDDYAGIPIFINFRIEKGLEPDFIIDYDNLIYECIDKYNFSSVFDLYAVAFEKLNDNLKKDVFNFFVQNKDRIYISDDRIDGFIDLLTTAHRLGEDISPLWEAVDSKVLTKLCNNEQFEILDVFYKKADEKGKNLIDAFKKINDIDVVTPEIVTELMDSIEDISTKGAIVRFAVRKGYTPPIRNIEIGYYNERETISILINKNLAYYLLTKTGHTYLSYDEEQLEKNITDPNIKKAYQLFKDYTSKNFWYAFGSNGLIYELEEMLDAKNIANYFDEEGIKFTFLDEAFYKLINNVDYSSDNSFALFLINKCRSRIPEEEKNYYNFIETALKFHQDFSSYGFDEKYRILVKSKEDFNAFIKDEASIIKFLQYNKSNLEIVLALLKVDALTENVITTVFNKKEIASFEVIKELLDADYENTYVYKELYQNSSLYDENGVKKDDLIKYLLENYYVDAVLKLSNKYVSDQQKALVTATSKIYTTIKSEEKEKLQVLINAVVDQDQLDKYIVDNKPTKELIGKFFELGFLYCIEGHENLLNDKQRLIYEVYQSIDNDDLKKVYCDFIEESISSIYSGAIKEETIKMIPELLDQIKLSNSSEVAGRYTNIAKLILQNTSEKTDDPLIQFKRIEKIFLTKELSHMDKIFKSFQLLYPHEKLIKKIKEQQDNVSPTLYHYATTPEDTILGKEALILYGDSTYAVEMVMYADLLKTTIASNDKTFIEYIENIEKGNDLFTKLMTGEKQIETLEADEKYILNSFVFHLENLYNKVHPIDKIKLSNDLNQNLNLLMVLYRDIDLSKIPDQIIKNKYQAYLGISTMSELKEIMSKSKTQATLKGYEYAKRPMVLEKGDIIKGIGGIIYFDTIIQNGSVSKEFLGGDVDSDLTPFDTDLSVILETKATNNESRENLEANNYGPIFFIIKDAIGKCHCTRNEDGVQSSFVETSEAFAKMEIFRTLGKTHFGIRTGFPTTQIDYICCHDKELVDKIGLVLAKNGFYIPVVNRDGELIFTPEQYEHFRGKMAGLSYYGIDSFEVMPTVRNEYTETLIEAIRENIGQTEALKKELIEKLREGFASSGLLMKTQIDGDMQPGSVELIDTGSTGRGTNQIGDGDFDFTIRLDKIINESKETAGEVAQKVCISLGIDPQAGDLRKAKIPLSSKEVELDISYANKSDRITYTTDMSLADRLETIKRQDPEQYLFVLANIVLAKTLLKKGECYKPHHASENPQGGLGGVGTENWILQNGGSLEEAATEFLIAAGIMRVEVSEDGKKEIIIDETTQKEYDTFKTTYSIWDFGQNQLTEKRSRDFAYDNFIWNNMNAKGYAKMAKTMQTYILELHPEFKFVPKPIPQDETTQQKSDRESLETVETNVRNLLQGIKPVSYTSSSIETEKGK